MGALVVVRVEVHAALDFFEQLADLLPVDRAMAFVAVVRDDRMPLENSTNSDVAAAGKHVSDILPRFDVGGDKISHHLDIERACNRALAGQSFYGRSARRVSQHPAAAMLRWVPPLVCGTLAVRVEERQAENLHVVGEAPVSIASRFRGLVPDEVLDRA